MDSSYVPPWRRRQAPSGESGDAPAAEHAPNDQLPQNNRYNNRGNNGRGRGHRGHGRGGRGGYRQDFFQRQNPQVDETDLYRQRDIDNHFWGEECSTRFSHSSTFHDSKDRPENLSYLLLFFGANPRWANDRIVFAKSKLSLLPEYAVKKAEKGEWETEKKMRQNATATSGSTEASTSEDKDAAAATDKGVTNTTSQNGRAISAEARTLSSAPGDKEKQSHGFDQSSAEPDTAMITATTAANSDGKEQDFRVTHEHVLHGDCITAQDLSNRVQESNISDKNNEAEPPKENAEHGKEGQHTDKEVEEVAKKETRAIPISTPSPSTASASRSKYTDIRLEEAQAPAPASSTVSGNRMKYTDIRLEEVQAARSPSPSTAPSSSTKYNDVRTIPANEFYDEPSPAEPVFPAIAPIDYAPSRPAPIAVFEERKIPGLRTGGIHSRFAFKGWFRISRVNILAPHSAELVRMLQQKWERKDRFGNVIPTRNRDASAWNSSLAVEWAVIKFDVWDAEGAPPPPQIEKLPEPEGPVGDSGVSRGVNELLSDMRLNDGKLDTQKGENLAEDAAVKPDESLTAKTVGLFATPPA
jgi:hypothetical protein